MVSLRNVLRWGGLVITYDIPLVSEVGIAISSFNIDVYLPLCLWVQICVVVSVGNLFFLYDNLSGQVPFLLHLLLQLIHWPTVATRHLLYRFHIVYILQGIQRPCMTAW